MKNNANKTVEDNYKNKRQVFSTPHEAPFMRNFFSTDDIEPIITTVFDGMGNCDLCTDMLNSALKMSASLYPQIDRLTPSSCCREIAHPRANHFLKHKESYSII